ncbi:unnamed protein product [Protopolystoma xenopodis]|uniref:Uncharacterized protein n=1 Tax=Protopolystoma xenopodis TaxID=117903 RepID=A0A448XI92_9PLAT|nr:unnamed protein product [Protopolystoma xenopodis]
MQYRRFAGGSDWTFSDSLKNGFTCLDPDHCSPCLRDAAFAHRLMSSSFTRLPTCLYTPSGLTLALESESFLQSCLGILVVFDEDRPEKSMP